MKTYKVSWEIDIFGVKSPQAAAKEALDSIINGTAKVFTVTEINKKIGTKTVLIDLEDAE